MNKLLPLSIALLLFSSCVEERSRRKARVFMLVAVAAVCIAFTSACDKEQSQKEDKFDIELLGKESKMMADINGRSFTREFIFSRPKLSFDNNGQVFLFAGELLKNDYEYINFTIKLS